MCERRRHAKEIPPMRISGQTITNNNEKSEIEDRPDKCEVSNEMQMSSRLSAGVLPPILKTNKQSGCRRQDLFHLNIDFHRLNRPGHLANSQVLKMLEEEEFDEFKHKGFKRFAWPPPPENVEVVPEITEEAPAKSQEPKYTKAKIVPSTLIEPPEQQQRSWESQISSRPVSTYDSVGLQQPPQPKIYKPVNFEPPKAFVKLRPSPPIQQEPPPIFDSQPAVLLEQGGARMRGDQKWPPESYKRQAEAENEARIALARGPAFRPRKVHKDYTSFFAQNAINATYPSYRAPPGTQHYLEDGTSQF